MSNFKNIKLKFLTKFNHRRLDCGLLSRFITGYPYTKNRLFNMDVIDSLSCKCNELTQCINLLGMSFIKCET